ncbi:MAG: hypothetical protein II873_02230 [Oscillospiraceae bacterium]|nr:hypothetical protein [Oscillospiraceae bacterium]
MNMSEDMVAMLLGIAAAALYLGYRIWETGTRRKRKAMLMQRYSPEQGETVELAEGEQP